MRAMARMRRTAGLTLILTLALAAGAAAAQTRARLLQGPMAPCLADHLDPARYQAELAAQGWVPLPEPGRPIAASLLAQAFLPVTHPPIAGQPDDPARRLALAAQFWQAEIARRGALFQYDAVLMASGLTRPDGARLLECWMVTPDAEFVDRLIDQAAGDTALPADRGVAAALAAEEIGPGRVFQLVATRQPGAEGPAHGLLTQVIVAPPAE